MPESVPWDASTSAKARERFRETGAAKGGEETGRGLNWQQLEGLGVTFTFNQFHHPAKAGIEIEAEEEALRCFSR